MSSAPVQSTREMRPYILVEGESKLPSGITLFATTGGHWNVIEVPQHVLKMPWAEQLPRLMNLMHAYLDQYGGHCPFFGRVRGFRFVRQNDSLRFTERGDYAGRDERPFGRPRTELRVGNKIVESLFR